MGLVLAERNEVSNATRKFIAHVGYNTTVWCKEKSMNQFIIIVTILISITIVVRVGFFLKFKIDLTKGRIRQHKLKDFRHFAWYSLFGFLACVFSGIVFFKIHDSYDFLIGWSSIALANLINIFIVPRNYILTNKYCMKQNYIGRKYLWNTLKITQKETELHVIKGKKSMHFEFENLEDFEFFRRTIGDYGISIN